MIDFDHHSKEVWYVLNKKYRKASGSTQYDLAGDAYGEITSGIDDIANQYKSHASFGTKCNAIETLRKICKSIALSDNSVTGHEVRKMF